ncbi:M10 family metallopeptidase C-terminal domain-containing protein [Sphingobium rhizovicinum]|uniref:M10 family metallopeptidase C-terminal domain-containing protein n=1 Tax=Sphingobium rhizovicinum TaxID=432308 RepID=A0ABV7NA71_9SPHN
MFKVDGNGPLKSKTASESGTVSAFGAPLDVGASIFDATRVDQLRSATLLLYPQDVMTPPTTGSAGDLDAPQENGSGSTTVAQGATGDQRIDGILSGIKWANSLITYADTDSPADYQAGYNSDADGDGFSAQNEGFSQFTAQQTLAMHTALNDFTYTQLSAAYGFSVEGFTNLGIDYAGAGSSAATIRAANSSDPTTAYAYYPNANAYGGDTFFGNYYDSTIYTLKNPVAGNYAWHTMLHELGHSLGLKHGQETGGFGALPTAYDSVEFSVMTYRSYVGAPLSGYSYEQFGAPQTYMMLDIAALQAMYGADYSVQSGDTVYTWSPTTGETYINGSLAIDPGGNRIFATIWDGGGVDTYDLSNYTTNLSLDLNPGGYSVFSQAQLAYLGNNGSDVFARGNIFNALLYGGNSASMIENAIGGSGNDIISGNYLANVLSGGAGGDAIYAGDGADTVNGDDGNDYIFGDYGSDTLNGGAGNDIIDGADSVDVIYGGSGNDTIYGGWESDTLYGEAGDDVFINREYLSLSNVEWGDTIDGGSGTDRLDLSGITATWGAIIDLAAGTWRYEPEYGGTWSITSVENIDGTQQNDVITGSTAVNVINGNAGNDQVYAGSGNDVVNGGDGDDLLVGGAGNDVFNGGGGKDLVYGEAGNDTFIIEDGWIGSYGEIFAGGAGSDTFDFSATSVTTSITNLDDGEFSYTPFGSGAITLSSVENVVGNGGADTMIGTGAANIFTGNGGNDVLQSHGGADTLLGGDGNDLLNGGGDNDTLNGGADTDTATYAGALGAVTVSLAIAGAQATGGSGSDTLISIENLTGSSYNDTLTGNSGANTLNGGEGADVLAGGTGNDIYYVDDAGDNVVELDGAGTDTIFSSVSYALTGRIVETLTLLGAAALDGIGNNRANTINGNDGSNILSGLDGNDTLNGGLGADTLNGGAGNDIMDGGAHTDGATYVDATAAVTVSLAIAGAQNTIGAGTDTLINIEKLIGSGFNDTLTGNSGNNTLDGGAGADVLTGGTGDDIYYVDNVGDNVVEADGGGTDRIFSSVSYTLSGRIVETLTLTGSANINGTGNGRANTLTGNIGNNVLLGLDGNDSMNGGSGDDMLNGGLGADSMTGALGQDRFVFDSALGGGNIDTITDYTVADDTISLENAIFTGLATGTLSSGAFFIGSAANDSTDRIIYNSATGALLFDADGTGATAAIQFATLSTGLALTASEFVVT